MNSMMNSIEVNPQSLEAEALAAVADAPPPPAEPGQELVEQQPASQEQIQQGYEVLFTGMVGWSAQSFAPNWALTPAEVDGMSKALTGACMLWFPDQPIPAKYLSLLTVAAAAAQIVAARRDPETGQLKPLRAKPAEATASA